MTNLQKAYEFYRFTRLTLDLIPAVRFETTLPSTSASGLGVVAYYPEITTATTTSLSVTAVAQLSASRLLALQIVNANTISSTVNSSQWVEGETKRVSLRVPRSVLLATPTRWFRTGLATTAEDLEIDQGTLIFAVQDAAGANTVVQYAHLSYTCEFNGQADMTTLTLTDQPDNYFAAQTALAREVARENALIPPTTVSEAMSDEEEDSKSGVVVPMQVKARRTGGVPAGDVSLGRPPRSKR